MRVLSFEKDPRQFFQVPRELLWNLFIMKTRFVEFNKPPFSAKVRRLSQLYISGVLLFNQNNKGYYGTITLQT